MSTAVRIIAFVVYLVVIVAVYLSSYNWTVERFSTVQYVTDSLGTSNRNWIILVGYCIWTFGTMETVLDKLQTNTHLVRFTILILDVFAVLLSLVLFVLYNNTQSNGIATTADVLSIFFLLMVSGGLNVVFLLVLKIYERLVKDTGNNSK